MRKILLFLIISLTYIYCYSQNVQKIDGIGKIRLGMTVSELRNIFREDIKDANDFNKGITSTFVIQKYVPVEGYYINDFNLIFYKDSLYAMYSVEGTNIKDALKIKYGDPKMDIKEEVKEYVNGFGNKIEKLDQAFNFTWETGNPDIVCSYTDQVVHSSIGIPNRYTVFRIENQRIFNEIKMIRNRKDQMESQKRKQENIEKLNDL